MKKIASIILITGLFFSDFLVLNLDEISILSAWKEVLSIIFASYLILILASSFNTYKSIVSKHKYQLVLIFGFLILYLFCGDLSMASARSFRALSAPIFISLIVASILNVYSLEYKLSLIFKILVAMTLISGVYAVYQYISIVEESEFWYWNLLIDKGHELETFNSIRDDQPRMSGFFTGTLELSAVILNSAVLILSILFQKLKRGQFSGSLAVLLMLFVACSALIAYGTVRNSIIGLISISFFMMILQFVKSKGATTFLGYIFFIALTAAIFSYLALGYTDELSAIDRVRQWAEIIELMQTQIFGYGFSQIGHGQRFWFDSFWLNLIAACGILGGVVMVALIGVYQKIVGLCSELRKHGGVFESAFADYIIVIYPFYLSSFFFQSYSNSTALYLFSITVIVTIFDVKFNADKISSSNCSL